MSRIGKKPVVVPKGVEVQLKGSKVEVKGPLGTLNVERIEGIDVKVEDGQVVVDNQVR